MLVSSSQLETFAAAARQAGAYGLMRCSSGNMSFRLDEQHLLVKASRCWMANLTPDDVSVCRLSDGALLQGRSPSVEMGFHAGILRNRPDVRVVLHFQTPFATTFACMANPPASYNIIPEVPYYIGPIAHVPYIRPGSPELAVAVVEAMKDHNLAQLANHGQVVVGDSYDSTLQKAVFFELACQLMYQAGGKGRVLTAAEIATLLAPDGKV